MRRGLALLLLAVCLLASVPFGFSRPDYEDFTTYTVQEEGTSDITVVNSTFIDCDFGESRWFYAYAYKNYGADYFANFTMYLDVYWNASERSSSLGIAWLLLLNNSKPADPQADAFDLRQNGSLLYLDFNFLHSGANKLLRIGYWNTTHYVNDAFAGQLDVWYYLNLTRTDTAFVCKIYNSAANRAGDGAAGLHDTLSLTVSNQAGRYLYAGCTYDDNLGIIYAIHFAIRNLEVMVGGTPVYITFYNTTGGVVWRNGTLVANTTETQYANNSLIEFSLAALVNGNLTYGFANFTWNSHYNISNPYDFSETLTQNMTVWTYFGVWPAVTPGIGIERKFMGVIFLGFFIALPLILVLKKKQD